MLADSTQALCAYQFADLTAINQVCCYMPISILNNLCLHKSAIQGAIWNRTVGFVPMRMGAALIRPRRPVCMYTTAWHCHTARRLRTKEFQINALRVDDYRLIPLDIGTLSEVLSQLRSFYAVYLHKYAQQGKKYYFCSFAIWKKTQNCTYFE